MPIVGLYNIKSRIFFNVVLVIKQKLNYALLFSSLLFWYIFLIALDNWPNIDSVFRCGCSIV